MVKFYSLLLAVSATAFAANADVDYTMNNWSVNPANGEKVSKIETVTVHFSGLEDGIDTHIINSNAPNYISISDENGTKYYPTGFQAGTVNIDDLVLTFDPITHAGTYTLNIAEGVVCDYDQKESHDEGEGYSVNPPISATYVIEERYMNVWTLDPPSGSELTNIHYINLDFPLTETRDGIDSYRNPLASVTLTCGNQVYYPEDWRLSDSYAGVTFIFDNIKEPGKYVLNIGEETFKEYDTYEDESVSPEIVAYYEILPPVSVDTIGFATNGDDTVFDLQGRALSGKALAPGIYIAGGKKLVVR